MALKLPPVQTESLVLTAELSGHTLSVQLRGNADSASNDAFGLFFTRLHGEAQRLRVKKVELDLQELYFMTSCCIKCLVTWIGQITNAPRAQQYRLNFLINTNLRWQKRYLDVLLQLTKLATLTERAS